MKVGTTLPVGPREPIYRCRNYEGQHSVTEHTLSRRDFLAASACAAASVPLAPVAALQAVGGDSRPKVIRVASDHVVRGRYVHDAVLREMLELTLTTLTGKKDAATAWRSVLRPDDMIGLKFNSSGAAALATNEKLAGEMITSILSAGFERRQIVAIEAPDKVYAAHGVSRPVYGWQSEPTEFGSGRDNLAVVLDQVTAIVNVPFLKSHNIAGITCSLKNLSHAMVKHPARFHANHCAPFIGDIVALSQIRDKLRLNIVNALRVVFDKGPEPRSAGTWDAGMLLGGIDPVATDSTGLDIVNSQRLLLGMDGIDLTGRAHHLRAAWKRGVGQYGLHEIERVKLRI